MSRELLHGNSRMLVLALLTKSEMHPYGMRKELIDCTKSGVYLSLGHLYPLLASMEKEGLVRSHLTPGRGTQLRRVYRITAAGRRRFKLQAAVWRTFARNVDEVLNS